MGFLTITVRAHNRGPLFNGQARRATRDFNEAWERETAEEALGLIKDSFHIHFKHPTGYYESHVRIKNDMGGHPVVHDGGLIKYGPWLEGVGSRNATTRFKGYHSFRNAAAVISRRAEHIGTALLHRRYLRRMN